MRLCCHEQAAPECVGWSLSDVAVWCRRCFSSMTRFLPDCWRQETQPGISCQPRMTPRTATGAPAAVSLTVALQLMVYLRGISEWIFLIKLRIWKYLFLCVLSLQYPSAHDSWPALQTDSEPLRGDVAETHIHLSVRQQRFLYLPDFTGVTSSSCLWLFPEVSL